MSICVSINRVMTTENIFWLKEAEKFFYSICFKLKKWSKTKAIEYLLYFILYIFNSIPPYKTLLLLLLSHPTIDFFFCSRLVVVLNIFMIISFHRQGEWAGEERIKIIIKFLYSTLSRFRNTEQDKILHLLSAILEVVYILAARQIAYPNELLIGWK